jgi:hypothetical protein
MGMFILGDNDPFFKDANVILPKLGLPTLRGNEPGGQVVKERTSKGGFKRHPITTGLMSLYEGITVSVLPEDVVTRLGMVDIVREHQSDKISVAYLEAQEGNGKVVVDGAFTRLFSDSWHKTTGTARFVTNIASLLAVRSSE